jgi:hypothetical protein
MAKKVQDDFDIFSTNVSDIDLYKREKKEVSAKNGGCFSLNKQARR